MKETVQMNKQMRQLTSIAVAFIGFTVFAQQDRSTLKVPGGLAFSQFKGYDKMGGRRSQRNGRQRQGNSGKPYDDQGV